MLTKTRFWQQWAGTLLNGRQTLVLNRVLDGMEGKLRFEENWQANQPRQASSA